jgi:diguanylate cyclase (GGDEF)-like protein
MQALEPTSSPSSMIRSRIRSLFAHRRARSIRASLVLLVAACVLPGSLMSAYLIFDNYEAQREDLIHDAIATARAMASTLDRDLASVEAGLQVLAMSPLLLADDLEGFYRQAKEVLPSQNASNYVLLDPTGRQRLNTLVPYGGALPMNGGSPQSRQVFWTDITVVSDLFVAPVAGKAILGMTVPVHRDGKIVYGLSGGIVPGRIAVLLQRQKLPPEWIAAVFDGTGNVIARTRDTERFVGKKGVPDVVKAIRANAEGTLDTVSLEGNPAIVAYSRSGVSDWSVAVAIPKSALTAGIHKPLWILIATTAILLAGGLWLAWRLGDRIANAMHGLTGPALELGSGKAVRVAPLRLKEADEVGQALMAASDLLLTAQRGAHYDVLTGLANRALLHELLQQQLALCVRTGSELAVLYIDLDGFKRINDRHGHAVGDDLLRLVATRISGGIRASDVAARVGGDEFVVLLVQSGADAARAVAAKLVALLSAPCQLRDREIAVSASIGIAIFPDSAASSASLLERADVAMYEAKKAGRNGYAVAGPLGEAGLEFSDALPGSSLAGWRR